MRPLTAREVVDIALHRRRIRELRSMSPEEHWSEVTGMPLSDFDMLDDETKAAVRARYTPGPDDDE